MFFQLGKLGHTLGPYSLWKKWLHFSCIGRWRECHARGSNFHWSPLQIVQAGVCKYMANIILPSNWIRIFSYLVDQTEKNSKCHVGGDKKAGNPFFLSPEMMWTNWGSKYNAQKKMIEKATSGNIWEYRSIYIYIDNIFNIYIYMSTNFLLGARSITILYKPHGSNRQVFRTLRPRKNPQP